MGGRTSKGHGKTFGMMDVLRILIYWVCKYVKLIKLYTFVKFIVCQLHHNKNINNVK